MKVKDLTSRQMVLRTLKNRQAQRNHFEPFLLKAFSIVDPGAEFKYNWHIGYLAEYAEACYLGQIKKLIVNQPPRTLKSQTFSVGLPAWVLGKDPSFPILGASGVQKLATRFNFQTRLVMLSDWYTNLFPGTQLREGQREKMKFETTKGGYRQSMSVGGSVIGEGGLAKIIDDPIDVQKTFNIENLLNCNDWYDLQWSTRSNDPKKTWEILVMQRLHYMDLTAHLLSKGDWEHIVIPQEAPCSVLLTYPISGKTKHREEGEILHPARKGRKELDESKNNLGSYGYESQENQRPTAKGGNRIKMPWFPRFKPLVKFEHGYYDQIVFSADTANSAKELANPTALGIFGKVHGRPFWDLFGLVRKRLAYPQLKSLLINLNTFYRPTVILVENKASGQQIIQEADIMGIPAHGIEPGKMDKVMRMETEMPALENGKIRLPEDGSVSWLYEFTVEVESFPMAITMDQIDMLSQFLKWLREEQTFGAETW